MIERARLHAALGDPVRLAIVEDLVASDRTSKELASRYGIASNLLAHHLDVLETVGLIERLASSGDRRRRYLRLRRGPLARLGIVTTRPVGPALFVCSANSARSQLAAALWRSRTGCPATSAGTHPAAQINPEAIEAGRRIGLDLGNQAPRSLGPDETAEIVVSVCDQAHEEIAPEPSWWHWSVPDPVEVGTPAAFDAALAELQRRIEILIEHQGAA